MTGKEAILCLSKDSQLIILKLHSSLTKASQKESSIDFDIEQRMWTVGQDSLILSISKLRRNLEDHQLQYSEQQMHLKLFWLYYQHKTQEDQPSKPTNFIETQVEILKQILISKHIQVLETQQ